MTVEDGVRCVSNLSTYCEDIEVLTLDERFHAHMIIFMDSLY